MHNIWPVSSQSFLHQFQSNPYLFSYKEKENPLNYTTWRWSRQNWLSYNILRLTQTTSSVLCQEPPCDTPPLPAPTDSWVYERERSVWIAILYHDDDAAYKQGTVSEMLLKICTNHHKPLTVIFSVVSLSYKIISKTSTETSLIHFFSLVLQGKSFCSYILLQRYLLTFSKQYPSTYRNSAATPGNHYPYCYKLFPSIYSTI